MKKSTLFDIFWEILLVTAVVCAYSVYFNGGIDFIFVCLLALFISIYFFIIFGKFKNIYEKKPIKKTKNVMLNIHEKGIYILGTFIAYIIICIELFRILYNQGYIPTGTAYDIITFIAIITVLFDGINTIFTGDTDLEKGRNFILAIIMIFFISIFCHAVF